MVVRGETGSGKTTQLPKICLASGRGAAGWIGHTQPRRIAARSVAARLARELGARVGEGVGSRVRFHDEVGPNAYLKVMTDGILVAEIASDPLLEAYDTLIIDEAHERSLNIDLLLGHLKSVLPERPDLRVVVSSATLDPKRISDYFDGAPIIEVSGRAYPVETRYAEADAVPEDPVGAVPEAVRAVAGKAREDILVFLPGERDIREAARALRGDRGLEVLPLYARLNHAQQERIFRPGERRRVVLATNVAETSITVPGSGSWSIPDSPASAATASAPGCSAFPSSRSRGPPPTSAGDGAGGWGRGCACGSTRARTSSPARGSPPRRSGARTSPRSSFGWPRAASGGRTTSPSSILRTAVSWRTAFACSASSARSTRTIG